MTFIAPRFLQRSGEGIGRDLARWDAFVAVEKVDRIAARTAELLVEGAVVGWVQGRSEFGPRALGNRSIVADPRPASNKDRINQLVKKREGFRPFAPSVQSEYVDEFFKTTASQKEFPFMIFVLGVREEKRALLGAVTHVDGTARVHTVSRQDNPLYWELLGEFGARTGIPMLLNTSFNNNAEPIIDDVDDAVTCFMTTGLDYLVVGDRLVTRRAIADDDPVYEGLVPNLPRSRKLVRRSSESYQGNGAPRLLIESTANDYFCEARTEVTKLCFDVLMAADGHRHLGSLLDELDVQAGPQRRELIRTMLDLWSRRIISLRPGPASRR